MIFNEHCNRSINPYYEATLKFRITYFPITITQLHVW
jgi:hypothetical protein